MKNLNTYINEALVKKHINMISHEFIDLDLPSGTLWAECNLGADNPNDYGYYFSWGETEPKSDYSTNKYFDSAASDYIKYNTADHKRTLDDSDDAAIVMSNGDSKMPISKDVDELINNTNHEETENGYKFISKKDSTKYIFIPLGGIIGSKGPKFTGDEFNLWCKGKMEDGAQLFTYDKQYKHPQIMRGARNLGANIRAIKKKN